MYLIYNNDGSIKFAITNDYIQQGSNNVNYIDIAIDNYSTSNYTCDCLFTLPNSTTITLAGVVQNFSYSGENYSGYRIWLSSAVLAYAGILRFNIRLYNSTGAILYTYQYEQNVNAASLSTDWEAPITQAQYNSFMALLTTYINAYDQHLIRKYASYDLALADIANLSLTQHVLVNTGTSYDIYYKSNDTTLTLLSVPTNWTDIFAYIGLTQAQLTALGFNNLVEYIDSNDISTLTLSMLTGVLTATITLKNNTTKTDSIDLSQTFNTKTQQQVIDNEQNTNIQTAQTTANSALTNANQAINNAQTAQNTADEALALANTKNKSYSFATFNDMKTALASAVSTIYHVGDNLYIEATDSPDYWVSKVNSTPSGDYGYYEIQVLETDTSSFAKQADLNITNQNVATNTTDIATLQSTQNKVQQLDFTGTLSANVLTFESGTIYDLVDNTFYELDLHFSASGTINDNTSVSLVNNSTTITLNSILGSVVGSFRQVQTYSTDIGYRWVFLALFNTSNGVSTFTILPTINRQDILCLKGSEITSTLINSLANNQVILCTESGNTYVLGHLYLATCNFTNNAITLSDKSIFVPTKTSELTNDTGYITATNYAGETVGGVIIASSVSSSETNLVEVKINTTTHKLYAPSIPTLDIEIVSSLPTTGSTGVIYLVPATSTTTTNLYKEYVWVNSAWEEMGNLDIQLSNYATITWVQSQLNTKQNVINITDNTLGTTYPFSNIVILTQNSYDNLTTKDSGTKYIIKDNVASYLGTIQVSGCPIKDLYIIYTSKASLLADYPSATTTSVSDIVLNYNVGMNSSSAPFYNYVALTSVNNIELGSNFTSGHYMFQSCSVLTTVPAFNTSKVTNMQAMFEDCSVLTSVPLFDTKNVTNMYAMFHYCYALTTVPLFVTSNVTNMGAMFSRCSSLASVPLFDTSKVTGMYGMFDGCSKLTAVPLFDTSKVTNMEYMFYECSQLLAVPLFDTSKVTSMVYMFHYCSVLTTVPAFDISSVTNMDSMFFACTKLTSILMYGMKVSFDISASTLFTESALVTILNNLATVGTTQTLKMGATNLAKLTDADKLIATNKGWSLA